MISVIIPTLNEAALISQCLDHVLSLAGDWEVIISDGGSRDATRELASRHPGVRVLRGDPGRGRQMNRGAEAAGGEVLLFLHVDTRLPAKAHGLIIDALARPRVAAGSFCLSFDHSHPLLRLYALFSRINHPCFTFGDQGFFMTAKVFKEIGGFAEIGLMEDMEIQTRLRKQGRFYKASTPVITSARRFLKNGIVKNQLRNTWLVTRYLLGADPERLARAYT